MVLTKEKIVAAIALLVAGLAAMRSLGQYRRPGAVDPPAATEEARRYEPEETLIPILRPKTIWDGKGRNPFSLKDSYSDQAPVPLPLPPSLGVREFSPSPRLDKGFASSRAIVEEPPPIAPEPKLRDPLEEAEPAKDGG